MRSLACLSLALCAACGTVKDNGTLADAPPLVDSTPEEPTTGTVHVTVLDSGGGGGPAIGAKVVFINPDGTVVKQVATDSQGKADAEITKGANVTSIQVVGVSTQLQTVTGLKPNDDIVIGVKNSDTTMLGTMTVTFPSLFGATTYLVSSPCGAGFASQPAAPVPPTLSATLTYYTYCNLPAEIVVSANDNIGSTITSGKKAGVTFASGGTVNIAAYDRARTFTTSLTNVNANVSFVSLNRGIPDSVGVVTSTSAGAPIPATLTLTGPDATNALIETFVTHSTNARQTIRQALAGTAATYGLDFAATLLPWLTMPTYDVATHKVTVGTDTTGTTTTKPDLVRVAVAYRRTDPQTQTVTTYSWLVWGSELTDVTLPALPAELAALLPNGTDVIQPSAAAVDADTVTGYDAIRADVVGGFSKYAGVRPPAALVRITNSPLIRR